MVDSSVHARIEHVVVVGAGLAGCLLSVLLTRRGISVDLYERRADPRLAGPERGRGINLAISARGLDALSKVGLEKTVLESALPMWGRTLHSRTGSLRFQSYSADGKRAINSISRRALTQHLLNCAQSAGVKIHFSHQLVAVDPDAGVLTFKAAEGSIEVFAEGIIASDGAYSVARQALTDRIEFNLRQDFLQHGYKELTIPSKHGDFALDPHSLHIWPRGSDMMIALPNTDKSFTCTLFWPKEGERSFASLRTASEIIDYFSKHYPDVLHLIPDLVHDFQGNPVGSLVTINCWPWARGRLGLLGDAAHAIVPFFGQGANAAFEDCIELDRWLDEAEYNWGRALDMYQVQRKPNTDAIADMSLENFAEMSDKVNSRIFQLQNSLRHVLERALRGRFVSRYELVSFTTEPYSNIDRRIKRQDRVAGLAAGTALAAGAIALSVAVRRNSGDSR